MKIYHSNTMRSDSCPSRPISTFPSSWGISEPTETLLVVDDNPMVRDVESQILRLQGHTVLEAEVTVDAFRLAREAAAIHLLITDFSMPEVDGLGLTRRFRAVHPKIPVLMVSGSLPSIQNRADDLDCCDMLAKPFQYGELLHKARSLLDAVAPLPRR